VSIAPHPEPLAVTEMKLIHDVHRAATSLLTDSAARPGASPAELGELRDFVVAALHHHLAGLPAPAVAALPAMRGQARATLKALRTGAGVAS
jgi:hypothetical protein